MFLYFVVPHLQFFMEVYMLIYCLFFTAFLPKNIIKIDQESIEGCKGWGFTPWNHAQKVSHLWSNITGNKRARVWYYDNTFSFSNIFWHDMLHFVCVYIFSFPVDERDTVKSVTEYFRETYDFTLKQTQWPCLQVGNQQRPNYLPMEVCALLICSLLSLFLGWRCFYINRYRFARL